MLLRTRYIIVIGISAHSAAAETLEEIAQRNLEKKQAKTAELTSTAEKNKAKKDIETAQLVERARKNQEAALKKKIQKVSPSQRDKVLIQEVELINQDDVSLQAQEFFDTILDDFIPLVDDNGTLAWPGNAATQPTAITNINDLLGRIIGTLKELAQKKAPLQSYILDGNFAALRRAPTFKRLKNTLDSIQDLIDGQLQNIASNKKTSRTTRRAIDSIQTRLSDIKGRIGYS